MPFTLMPFGNLASARGGRNVDRKRVFEIAYILLFPAVLAIYVGISNMGLALTVYLLGGSFVISLILIAVTSGKNLLPCEVEGCERDAVRYEKYCRPCRNGLLSLENEF